MTKKDNRTTSATVVLGVLLILSVFINIVVIWQTIANEPGFRIPAGDAGKGLQAFNELRCAQCHTVAGIDSFSVEPYEDGLVVPLGGQVYRVKTYGELITAIIHPSESIRPDVLQLYDMPDGKSLMPDYSEAMTTGQLMDIATFLEGHYHVSIPEYPVTYSPYGP
ncbi:MAG: cytochrome C [Puniceicoccaceae bacterium]